MATPAEIQKFVQRHHGFIAKTGWIGYVRRLGGGSRHQGPCGTGPASSGPQCPNGFFSGSF